MVLRRLRRSEPAAALELNTSIELDYTYTQDDLGGDVNATTQFNQKYEIKYETSLTTAYDFLGAVRLDLQDAWYTDQASTSQVAPTLEMATKGSQLAAKLAYEAVINSTDAYHETGDVTSYSASLTFDLEVTPALWPEVKLKFQRQRDFQENASENTTNTFEFSARKDIYALRLEYNFKREDCRRCPAGPARQHDNQVVRQGDLQGNPLGRDGVRTRLRDQRRLRGRADPGCFFGRDATYTQPLKTRLKNSLVIAPRMTLGLAWEYQFEQDLLALDFDYKLKNKYVLDLRWDAFAWLKIASEARRETDLTAAVAGADDERTMTDTLKAGFDLTSISWLRVSGKAEFRERRQDRGRHGRIRGQDRGREVRTDRQEPLGRTSGISPWHATTSNKHTDNGSRIARPKSRAN